MCSWQEEERKEGRRERDEIEERKKFTFNLILNGFLSHCKLHYQIFNEYVIT